MNGAVAKRLSPLMVALASAAVGALRAAIFTVSTAADTLPDGQPAPGSLREAILKANEAEGLDIITFNAPLSIAPTTALPVITDAVVIDGFVSGARVELVGSNAPADASGLTTVAGGCIFRGLVINRFKVHGLVLQSGGNVVEGCYLGTDRAGAAALPNGRSGLFIDNAPDNRIGGPAEAARNVISGNTLSGVLISGPGASGNRVQGNFIGCDATGTRAVKNRDGVAIANAPGNQIGGPNGELRLGNVISGNSRDGISLSGSATVGTTIQGNFIGVDRTGTLALANEQNGIFSSGATGTRIGGAEPGARNVISANAHWGIVIARAAGGAIIQGNYIGTDASGAEPLGNEVDGIILFGNTTDNWIGGPGAAARNVISANGEDGVNISGRGTANNVVQGNFIGTDAQGRAALGNGSAGVVLELGTTLNLIGGAEPGAGNVISANEGAGVVIADAGTSGNRVQGNLIGTDATGRAPLGNAADGVALEFDPADNLIGGLEPGEGNVIAFNGGDGVYAILAGTGNAILSNAIFENEFLGINLAVGLDDSVTRNDAGDRDTGPNELQNFPELVTASSQGGATTIEGTLDSLPDTEFTLQFFASAACDATGHGEGARYLGTKTTRTDAAGRAAFRMTLPTAVARGQFLTATATDAANNTSEFSPCLPVHTSATDARLTMVRAGNTVTILWPTTAGATLETSPSLVAPVWSKVSAPPAVEAGNYKLTLPASLPQSFFRLGRP